MRIASTQQSPLIRRVRQLSTLVLLATLTSCTYVQGTLKQAQYSQIQQVDPSQRNLKHMIERETFFVYGLIVDLSEAPSLGPLAVAAYSDRYRSDELVDVTFFAALNTHYALNLPAGNYELVVLADRNGDQVLSGSEVLGRRHVVLDESVVEGRVLTGFDIQLSQDPGVDWPIDIRWPEVAVTRPSLFYPQGTIRSMDDVIFDPKVATLGMYEPAAFLEIAPTMFYTLEEYLQYKVPVIFVHGINGTIRDFAPITEALDRDRYVPWFFYYPSGSDLGQLAENFYALFLSGRLFPKTGMPMIVVAHSMGGVVVREAMNLVQEEDTENQVAALITIASPLGGHPGAALSTEHAPLVLPSWRNMDPGGAVHQRALPKAPACSSRTHSSVCLWRSSSDQAR